MLDNIKSVGSLAMKGLLSANAPAIVKGVLIEILHTEVLYKGRRRKVSVKLLVDLVNENASLWALFPQETYVKAMNVLKQVSDLNWFTAEWMVEAIKEDHPALASLFLSWRKAHNWLGRQIEATKKDL